MSESNPLEQDSTAEEVKVEQHEQNEDAAEAARAMRDKMTKNMIDASPTPEALVTVLKALSSSTEGDPAIYDREFGYDRVINVGELENAIGKAQSAIEAGDMESAKHGLYEYYSYAEPGKEITEKMKSFFPGLGL